MQALPCAAQHTLCHLKTAAGLSTQTLWAMRLSSSVARQPTGWHNSSSSSDSGGSSMLCGRHVPTLSDVSCSHDAASLSRKWPAQQLACRTGRQATCLISSRQPNSTCWSGLLQQQYELEKHLHSFRRNSHLQQMRTAASQASISSAASSSSSSSRPRLPAATDISSTANAYIKHCVKLRENSRYRQQQRRLLLVGQTLLSELAEEAGSSLDILVLFMRPDASLPPSITAQRVVTVSDSVMKKLTGLEEASGVQVVAELALPHYVDLSAWPTAITPASSSSSSAAVAAGTATGSSPATGEPNQQQQTQKLQRLLVLESVQDPGNLGTLLRCAAAFGWDAVWLLPGCCDPFNDKALRASRGAALRWPLAAGSLEELLQLVRQQGMLLLAAHPEDPQQQQQQQQEESKPSSVGGTASSAECSTASASQQQPVCLVLGTEGAGLSGEVLAVATPLAVPMSGRMESLNVGVAGAILMFALSQGLEQLLVRLQQLGQMPGTAHSIQVARTD